MSLDNIGALLENREEYDKAEPYYRDTVEMRSASTAREIPRRTPRTGRGRRERKLRREALAMYRKLYPTEDYPGGHPDLIISLTNLSSVLEREKDYEHAEGFAREALAMCRRLFPEAKYSRGHPNLAHALNGLGLLLEYKRLTRPRSSPTDTPTWPRASTTRHVEGQGDYGKAESLCREALAMAASLPQGSVPQRPPRSGRPVEQPGRPIAGAGRYAKAKPPRRPGDEQALLPAREVPRRTPRTGL